MMQHLFEPCFHFICWSNAYMQASQRRYGLLVLWCLNIFESLNIWMFVRRSMKISLVSIMFSAHHSYKEWWFLFCFTDLSHQQGISFPQNTGCFLLFTPFYVNSRDVTSFFVCKPNQPFCTTGQISRGTGDPIKVAVECIQTSKAPGPPWNCISDKQKEAFEN